MDDEVWFFDIVDKMENRGRNEKHLTGGFDCNHALHVQAGLVVEQQLIVIVDREIGSSRVSPGLYRV